MESSATDSVSTLDGALALYEQGLYLQAYEQVMPLGPLQTWTDPEAQLFGGRLARNLGASRLGRIMIRSAYRSRPDDAAITSFYAMSMSERRSALESWKWMQGIGEDLNGADDQIQSDWYVLRGCTLALLRDFEQSEVWFERAIDLCPDRSWIYVSRVFLAEQQDRPEEALEFAQKAFDLQPWYRPAVQCLANRLVQMNRDDEAFELLREGCERTESGDLHCQLGALYLETQRYQEARELFDEVDRFYPLMEFEKKLPESLSARRADAAYYCGDHQSAAEHARKTDSEFYTALADRLTEEGSEGNRVILPVKFVRQNRLTCAPATLSALCEYWGRPVEHLEVADDICFDGTPAHSERRWADSEGYVTREFRLTLDVAIQLIDREIPFTLATLHSDSGHLQAVIGYDSYRQSVIIRDPGERHFSEFETKKMLEYLASSGPRGMIMVPKEKADLLDGIELPESELYDLTYQIDLALEKHKRDDAEKIIHELRERYPDHRLTLRAMGSLASYDGKSGELLQVANKLLEQFPDDVNFLMTKLACLQEQGSREDRIKLLKEQLQKEDCDPMFWLRYASELLDDAREADTSQYYLKRGLRYRQHDPVGYEMLASQAMERQDYKWGLQLYRFAACANEHREAGTQSYFFAARTLNQTNEALRFVQDRFQRFAKNSSCPTRTLCWALEQLDRVPEALKVVEKGLSYKPDDGELQLYAPICMDGTEKWIARSSC
ncbi:MAG: C39 family peptidase [Planctomycetota bacterium]